MGEPPAWWQQYRKAVIAAGVGLVAALTDLGVALSDGHVTAQEWVHVLIVFLSAVFTTGGVAAVQNTYSVGELQARLLAAKRGAVIGTVPPPDETPVGRP